MHFSYIVLILFALFVITNKLWCFWCRSKVCLVGRTAIITGGASGIGYQTALALASKGCRVIIADITNVSQAVKQIVKETQNPHIIGKHMDLQSFKSVRAFAKDILETEEKLHILVCNAGIGDCADDEPTEDGLHKTMQVNYFSHFLLTHLLLDLLKKSAPSRIIYTSSIVAYLSMMKADAIHPKSKELVTFYGKFIGSAYGGSKLAMTAAIKIFSEKLKGTGVTANSVHPGGVKTQIYASILKKQLSIPVLIFGPIIFLYGKNSEEGAQTLIHVAVSESLKDVTGQSFFEGMTVPQPYLLRPKGFCEKIWDMSLQLTQLK